MTAVLGEDRRLQVLVPDEIPVGAVEAIVLASSAPEDRSVHTLGELFAELDRMPHQPMTEQEVTRYLAEERIARS
jgi:hypothetical protein